MGESRSGGRRQAALLWLFFLAASAGAAEAPAAPTAPAPPAPAAGAAPVAGAAPATPAAPAPGAKHGADGEPLYNNLFTDTDLRQALADLATQTGVIIALDESVQGLISLELKDAKIETALDLLVMPGGFVWDKVSDGVYLVAKPDPKSAAFNRMSKVRVVDLKNLPARSLGAILPPLYQPMVRFDDEGQRVVITAPTNMLADITAFIAQVDTPGRTTTAPATQEGPQVVRSVDLTYLTAAQVMALVPAALKTAVVGDASSSRVFISSDDKQIEALVTLIKGLDTGQEDLQVVELKNTTGKDLRAMLPEAYKTRVTAAEDGNRAVVSAPPRQMEAIVAAVRSIDGQVAREKPKTVMQTVALAYVDAAQIVKMLPKAMLGLVQISETAGTAAASPVASTSAPASSSGGTSPAPPLAPDATRTLLLTGPAEAVADAVTTIKALDQPPVQVMMEALVVETTRGDLAKFEITSQDKYWGGSNVTGTLSYGGPATTLLHQILWLVEKSRAKVKASPRVIAQDGKEANVRVSTNQYFSIVSGRVGSEYVSLQAIEAAIGLTMTPRVALADKMITCTLRPEVGDVSGTGANALPIITTRSASTTVRVADGQVIAIGGLLQEFESHIRRKIPILGDLPLIGGLFRSTKDESSQREITIFVVPHILDAKGNFEGPLLFDRLANTTPGGAAAKTTAAAAAAPKNTAATTPGAGAVRTPIGVW